MNQCLTVSSLYRVLVTGLLLVSGRLAAQTVRVPDSNAQPGVTVEVPIELESKPGQEPLGLQWTIKCDPPLTLVSQRIAPAARDAGKDVRCALRKSPANSTICLLSGGQKPIANGAVALLVFETSGKGQNGRAKIRIEDVLAVSNKAKSVPVAAADGSITVSGK